MPVWNSEVNYCQDTRVRTDCVGFNGVFFIDLRNLYPVTDRPTEFIVLMCTCYFRTFLSSVCLYIINLMYLSAACCHSLANKRIHNTCTRI